MQEKRQLMKGFIASAGRTRTSPAPYPAPILNTSARLWFSRAPRMKHGKNTD
jgi:hypothetical protein